MRGLLRGFAALTLIVASIGAQAQEWPSKGPIRWIVPYPAGGGTDVLARALGTALTAELKQSFVIENRVGAATIVGAEATARSERDGYTIMSADNATLINNPAMYTKLPYNPDRDLEPVALIGRFPLLLVAGAKSNIRSYAELVALSKASPDKLTYASSGAGTPFHVGMELIKQRTHLSARHVPYRGMAPAVQDVVSGQVDIMVIDLVGSCSCAWHRTAHQHAGGNGRVLAQGSRSLAPADQSRRHHDGLGPEAFLLGSGEALLLKGGFCESGSFNCDKPCGRHEPRRMAGPR